MAAVTLATMHRSVPFEVPVGSKDWATFTLNFLTNARGSTPVDTSMVFASAQLFRWSLRLLISGLSLSSPLRTRDACLSGVVQLTHLCSIHA
jgi:hypothetical protein